MGKKFGGIINEANVEFPIILDSFQKKFGRESQAILKSVFPKAASEIKGITDVTGLDNETFSSWMMCMGCCHDISENKSVEVRGCTAFAFTDKGCLYYGRNNDLPPFLKKVSKSVYYRPENGYSFVLNTSSFINGEEGFNSMGLIAAMTFVKPNIEEIKPGLNSVFLVRYILEKCRNAEEGLDTLKRLPVASSCNILLADKSCNMLVAECTSDKINVRKPVYTKNGESFVVTVNHFVSQEMWPYDASDRNEYSSQMRYETAFNALSRNMAGSPVEYAAEILKGKYGFMCQYEKSLEFETIWSTIIDVDNNMIQIAEGDPRKAKYKIDKRLKKS